MKDVLITERGLQPWLDKDETDILGEQWRDIAGHEELYQISDFGRVKLKATPWRAARILKQTLNSPAVVVTLRNISKEGKGKQAVVKHLVVEAWGLRKLANQVWTNDNGVRQDNRLTNIVALTRPQLIKRLQAIGHWQQATIFGEQQRQKKLLLDQEVNLYEDGVLVGRICALCKQKQPLERYSFGDTGERTNRVCSDCRSRRRGTKNPGNARLGRELRLQGKRRCTLCKVAQPLDAQHFPPSCGLKNHGFSYQCFTCKPRIKSAPAQGSSDGVTMGYSNSNQKLDGSGQHGYACRRITRGKSAGKFTIEYGLAERDGPACHSRIIRGTVEEAEARQFCEENLVAFPEPPAPKPLPPIYLGLLKRAVVGTWFLPYSILIRRPTFVCQQMHKRGILEKRWRGGITPTAEQLADRGWDVKDFHEYRLTLAAIMALASGEVFWETETGWVELFRDAEDPQHFLYNGNRLCGSELDPYRAFFLRAAPTAAACPTCQQLLAALLLPT